jgi:uncharacterized protein (DUF4415 family)
MNQHKPVTGDDEAIIQAQIAADPDDEDATDEQLAQAKPFAEVFPELAASIKRSVGRPRLENARKAVTLRLSPQTLEKFEALGPDWRARMVEVLDKAEV